MESSLAKIRLKAGFKKQSELAEKIGVERATISRWESGNREPRLPMVSILAKALNSTDSEIITAISLDRSSNQ